MYYGILTNAREGGSPFKKPETPQTAPGDPLRVSEDATLVAFERQPTRLFARKDAAAYGKILWTVTKSILHPDDLPADEVFKTNQEFIVWLSRRDTK